MAELRENLARVRATIAEAAARAGRSADAVTLVAVSKTQPPELVAEVARLGVDRFGENRVQEAQAKAPRVRALLGRDPLWHLVGTLQRNKVKSALDLFAILESVDSARLAEAISRRAEGRKIPILLEVYLGDDSNRPGFRPDELLEGFAALQDLPGLDVRGLMTVAPLGLGASETADIFRRVADLRDRIQNQYPDAALGELSMGMTDDYPLAIEAGATIVRVGRAIFGERR
jgi:PLP dependent protein